MFMKYFLYTHLCDLAPSNILHLYLHIASVPAILIISNFNIDNNPVKMSYI